MKLNDVVNVLYARFHAKTDSDLKKITNETFESNTSSSYKKDVSKGSSKNSWIIQPGFHDISVMSHNIRRQNEAFNLKNNGRQLQKGWKLLVLSLSYKALHGLQNNFWYFEKYECVRTSRTENAMFLTLKESRTLKEYESNMNIQYLEMTFKSVHVCCYRFTVSNENHQNFDKVFGKRDKFFGLGWMQSVGWILGEEEDQVAMNLGKG